MINSVTSVNTQKQSAFNGVKAKFFLTVSVIVDEWIVPSLVFLSARKRNEQGFTHWTMLLNHIASLHESSFFWWMHLHLKSPVWGHTWTEPCRTWKLWWGSCVPWPWGLGCSFELYKESWFLWLHSLGGHAVNASVGTLGLWQRMVSVHIKYTGAAGKISCTG